MLQVDGITDMVQVHERVSLNDGKFSALRFRLDGILDTIQVYECVSVYE